MIWVQNSCPLQQLVDPGLKTISISAEARLDHPLVKDLQLVRIAIDAIQLGSDVYPRSILSYLTEGRGVHGYLTKDAAVVSLTVPITTKSDPSLILISLIKTPSFTQESIDEAIRRLRGGSDDFWLNEVDPEPFVLNSATNDEIVAALHRVFRLDRMTVAELAPREIPKELDHWNTSTMDWPSPAEPPLVDDVVLPSIETNPGSVSTGELIGTSFDPTSPDFAAQILALYALGAGKTSALYRISREEHAWSYRQESILTGSESGLEPRLFVAMVPDPEDLPRLGSLKDELSKDIADWTEERKEEALGMAEANLLRDLPFGPFIFANQPLSQDPEVRLDFGIYWKMKTGQPWLPTEMLDRLKKVELTTLKLAAAKILTGSKIHFLPAKPRVELQPS